MSPERPNLRIPSDLELAEALGSILPGSPALGNASRAAEWIRRGRHEHGQTRRVETTRAHRIETLRNRYRRLGGEGGAL